jgi:hypothetical protein
MSHRQLVKTIKNYAKQFKKQAEASEEYYTVLFGIIDMHMKDKAELVAALAELDAPVSDSSPCHVGLVPKEDCSRCGKLLRARALVLKHGRTYE